MGRTFLNDDLLRELNRIRPDVKVVRIKGVKGVKYADIVRFLINYYKKKEAKK